MLVQGDASSLEWRCAAFLSQDKTAIEEIKNEMDQHTDNQKRFNLPSRLIAKTFVFRLIYGGSAYSYATDTNFKDCNLNEKEWQKVIDAFYTKYEGLHKWHIKLMQEVTTTKQLILPTGRVYKYEPTLKRGEMVWPRTTILNYPVQGLGADIMALARVTLFNRLKALRLENCMLVNTVHDSLIIDAAEEHVDTLVPLMLKVFEDVPTNFKKLFGVEFNLPMKAEVEVGHRWSSRFKKVDGVLIEKDPLGMAPLEDIKKFLTY